jgi:hypothetical protein
VCVCVCPVFFFVCFFVFSFVVVGWLFCLSLRIARSFSRRSACPSVPVHRTQFLRAVREPVCPCASHAVSRGGQRARSSLCIARSFPARSASLSVPAHRTLFLVFCRSCVVHGPCASHDVYRETFALAMCTAPVHRTMSVLGLTWSVLGLTS